VSAGSIRALRREDVPGVAALYELVFRSGRLTASPEMVAYFEASFLDQPWVDPEIPSLVADDGEGGIAGFIGVHVRRMRFGDEPVRFACTGQFVVHPDARRRATGAFLLARALRGPQELSFTDGLTVREIWERMGGRRVPLSSGNWIRVLRPWRKGGDWLGRRAGRSGAGPALRPALAALDRVAARAPLFGAAGGGGRLTGEPLTPEAVAESLDVLSDAFRLRPDYDLAFLRWLFRAVAEVERYGRFGGRLVRDPAGRAIGWYAYYLQADGTCQVLQVAASAADVGPVLDHLFAHALAEGAATVQGRLEPHLVEPLVRRGAFLRRGEGALVHSSRPELVCALMSGDGLLSRLDGEWWMGHHLLPFGTPTAAAA
jgi:hypothetical protein